VLDFISEGFAKARDSLKGVTTLSEEKLEDALKLVSESLLEADVAYDVVKSFIKSVKDSLKDQTIKTVAGQGSDKKRIGATEYFVKACQEELERLLGEGETTFNLATHSLPALMMVGLQGSGKTTSTGKLAKYLVTKHKRKPLLVAADIYRPAAAEQLRVLAEKVGVGFYHEDIKDAVRICENAKAYAKSNGYDVLLYDTAGRLSIDEELMNELSRIKSSCKPDHIFFVCDAMMGQDAVTTADAFNQRLDLSGVVMTKLDGDTRGGAALSLKAVTGKPICFVGMGEGLDALEEFRPQGLASRILGLGDVVSLMEDFERVAEGDEEEQAMKMLQGQFNFNDFYKQIAMIQKMGSLKSIMAKLPMQGLIPKGMDVDDGELLKVKSMIDSMTKMERLKPTLLNPSRVQRIAKGSGRKTNDVQQLVQKFSQMRKMMASMGKNSGMLSRMMGGGMPDMSSMAGMQQMMMGQGAGLARGPSATKAKVDRDKMRKLRKNARKAKRKNRGR
jgi:signal recognition particle subunit SRP54